MPNIERLKTLLEYVEKLPPESIDMLQFRCGTAACLMGHAVDVFPERFKWNLWAPVDITTGSEERRGQLFFELSGQQWRDIFAPDIPNDQAVQNLREHIERWSNAQH